MVNLNKFAYIARAFHAPLAQHTQQEALAVPQAVARQRGAVVVALQSLARLWYAEVEHRERLRDSYVHPKYAREASHGGLLRTFCHVAAVASLPVQQREVNVTVQTQRRKPQEASYGVQRCGAHHTDRCPFSNYTC